MTCDGASQRLTIRGRLSRPYERRLVQSLLYRAVADEVFAAGPEPVGGRAAAKSIEDAVARDGGGGEQAEGGQGGGLFRVRAAAGPGEGEGFQGGVFRAVGEGGRDDLIDPRAAVEAVG